MRVHTYSYDLPVYVRIFATIAYADRPNALDADQITMSAFIPLPSRPRKPGPRLEIPLKASTTTPSGSGSSSGAQTPSSSSDDGAAASSATTAGSNKAPKLSLMTGPCPHGSLAVAAGFENLSLDEQDKTMRPGMIQPQATIPPLPAGKPKLGLMQNFKSPSPHLPNLAMESDAMTRSTSFEGALIAETSQMSIGGDDYKLSPETLQDLGRLGEGASGEVRKVLHKPSNTVMAKKTIPSSPNEDVQKQILRELAFNRECRADWITRYYGAFLEDSESQIAIVMEYCEGGSLDAIYRRIKERKGRTGEKVLGKVAESVLHGLVYLHDRKIIHRGRYCPDMHNLRPMLIRMIDIKPSNILVTRSGQFKLCDFGISGELINSMAGTFCGTSYYMAVCRLVSGHEQFQLTLSPFQPERIRGARYTITADVCCLYRFLFVLLLSPST